MKPVWTRILPFVLVAGAACTSPGHRARYRIALVPARSGQHGIFVMNSDSTGGKLLAADEAAQLRPSSWSPDGKRLVFFTYRPGDAGILGQYRIPSHFPLYIMDAGGNNPKRLLDFPVSDFGWAPDSRKMFFVSAYEDPANHSPEVQSGRRSPSSAIYLLDPQTGNHERVTSLRKNCYASWSPDSTRLAVSSGDDLETNISVASLDGRPVRRITDSQTINIRPSWSPNGDTIAYLALPVPGAASEEAGVYLIDADGTHRRRITDIMGYEASWSPDGKLLMISSPNGIYLVGAEGEKPLKLPLVTDRPLDALFTPDGQRIMFRSNHEGDWHIYSVDLKGGGSKRITGRLSAASFCLSPPLSGN